MLRRYIVGGCGIPRHSVAAGTASNWLVQSMNSFASSQMWCLKKGSKTLRMQAVKAVTNNAPAGKKRQARRSSADTSQKQGGSATPRRKSTAGHRRRRKSDRPREGHESGVLDMSPLSDRELAFANTNQIVGIMQSAYQDPEPSDLAERMLRHAEDLYDGGRRLDDLILQRNGKGHPTNGRRIRARALDRIQIPPVEVPSTPRTNQFLPRELLRRVMREEPGTSIVSRSVYLQCVLRRNPKYRGASKPQAAASKAAPSPSTAGPSEQVARRGNKKHSHRNNIAPAPSTVTPVELDEAALTGDAALVVHEASTHTAKQLEEAISDDRANTQIEDGGDDGVELPSDATTLSKASGKEVNLIESNKSNAPGGHTKNRTSPTTTDAADDDAPETTDDEGSAMDAALLVASEETTDEGGEDTTAMRDEDVEALLPWANGTGIPLSTNFFTRSERLDAPCMPFSPRPYAKRAPLLQLSGEMPPLSGVAMHGTVVAVRVVHNTRKALEDASHESMATLKESRRRRSSGGGERAATAGPPPQITLDRFSATPQIVVEFLDDDDQTDFSNFLFGEGPLE